MIFSLILTFAMLGLCVYALTLRKQFPFVSLTLPWVCVLGVYIGWFPNHTSHLARIVGIGRGADLMLYVWSLVSALLIFALNLKLVAQNRKITQLARVLALSSAQKPDALR